LIAVWNSGIDISSFGSDFSTGFNVFELVKNHFPFLTFCIVSIIITYKAVVKRWSLIPVLGLLTNLGLMSQLGVTNWYRFGIWLVVGLLIYFSYGSKHSRIKEDDITSS